MNRFIIEVETKETTQLTTRKKSKQIAQLKKRLRVLKRNRFSIETLDDLNDNRRFFLNNNNEFIFLSLIKMFFLTHTRFDIICWLIRDSIVYKNVCVSMFFSCRSIIFHSTQNFFFSENSMHLEQLTSSVSISRSWRFWIASVMRCLSLCVSSIWYLLTCLEFWLYILCWSFFLIAFVNFVNSSILTTRVASSWRRDRTSMFLRSLRVRNALLEINRSLFSRCETMLVEYYTTYVCLYIATYASTWSSILIVVNATHSCHCFIVILIFF